MLKLTLSLDTAYTRYMIVDFHTHIFPPGLKEERQRYSAVDATFRALYGDPKTAIASAEDLLASMDSEGVDVSVVMGVGWTDLGLAREANDYIIESVRSHSTRLVGFCGVNPAWGEEACQEIQRCAHAGVKGVGELHPDSQGFDLSDKRVMAPIAEAARSLDLLVLTHASEPVGHQYTGKGRTTPDVLGRFIDNFPDLTIVCAHWGGGLPFYGLMPEVSTALKNTYFDTAASPYLYDPQVFSTVASILGADKVLLGSDFPLLRQGRLLKQVRSAALTNEARAAILGGNAANLLGLSYA